MSTTVNSNPVFTAASALAGLAKDEKEEERNSNENNGEEFHIPQRFTKSGRKRAVPFTMKVRSQEAGWKSLYRDQCCLKELT